MRSLILISVVALQFCWTHGQGAFAYQDTSGNRYGGTYDIKDGHPVNFKGFGDIPFDHPPASFAGFQDVNSFFPQYFQNLQNLIQEAFAKNSEDQRKALDAARKAFDLTSNDAGFGYTPDFGFDRFAFPDQGFGSFGIPPMMQQPYGLHSQPQIPYSNAAFAGAAAGPGFQEQMINLYPPNPDKPNVRVSQFSDPAKPTGRQGPGFYSVSSSSFVTSSNVNGVESVQKGGETTVNENGKVTKYSLNS